MRSFFDSREPPGPLAACNDVYDYFERAVFFEGRRSEQGAEGGELLFAIWQADMEIINGGIAQFLCNGSGDFAEAALPGFETFGLPEIAQLLTEAFESLSAEAIPEDGAQRRLWLAALVGEPPGSPALRSNLAARMQAFDARYYRLRETIDSEHAGQGFLWRICSVIEAHRDDLFPDNAAP